MQQLKFEIDYEAHARGCAPDDFQRQVMRTPFGKPVSKEQVGLIMQAVMDGLAIAPEDMVLDLCCGNGVITDPIFALCAGGVGVDRSAALIGVAKANFERTGERIYVLWDALGYLQMTGDTDRITKMLCYGAFQYLSEQNAAAALLALRSRFPNLRQIFLGNLPDLDRAEIFWREHFGSAPWPLNDLKRNDTHFGIWRTADEVRRLAASNGWRAEITRMPDRYYAASVRFDAALFPI